MTYSYLPHLIYFVMRSVIMLDMRLLLVLIFSDHKDPKKSKAKATSSSSSSHTADQESNSDYDTIMDPPEEQMGPVHDPRQVPSSNRAPVRNGKLQKHNVNHGSQADAKDEEEHSRQHSANAAGPGHSRAIDIDPGFSHGRPGSSRTRPHAAHDQSLASHGHCSAKAHPSRSRSRSRSSERRDNHHNAHASAAAIADEKSHIFPSRTNCEKTLFARMTRDWCNTKAFLFKYDDPHTSDRINLCYKADRNSTVQIAYIHPNYAQGVYIYNKAVPREVELRNLSELHNKLLRGSGHIYNHDHGSVLKPRYFVRRELFPPENYFSEDKKTVYDPREPEMNFLPKSYCHKAFSAAKHNQPLLGEGSFFYTKRLNGKAINMCYLRANDEATYAVISQFDGLEQEAPRADDIKIRYWTPTPSEGMPNTGSAPSLERLIRNFYELEENVFSAGKLLLEPRVFIRP